MNAYYPIFNQASSRNIVIMEKNWEMFSRPFVHVSLTFGNKECEMRLKSLDH